MYLLNFYKIILKKNKKYLIKNNIKNYFFLKIKKYNIINIFQYYFYLFLNKKIKNINYFFNINLLTLKWEIFFEKNTLLKNLKKYKLKKKKSIIKYNFNINKKIIFFLLDNNKKIIFNYMDLFFNNILEIYDLDFFENIVYIIQFFSILEFNKLFFSNHSNNNKIFDINLLKNYWFFKNINLKKTNFIDIFFLNNYKINIYKNYIKYKFKNIFWLIQNIVIFILNKIFKKKVFIDINKYSVLDQTILKEIEHDLVKKNLIKKSIFLNNNFIEIFFIFFIFKDIKIFCQWIKYNFSTIFFRKQLTFLYNLEKILNYLFFKYSQNYNILGYKIIVKGKLNNVGSVRKKKIIIKNGITRFNNINCNINYCDDVILTITGVVGLNIYINFI